MTEMWLSQVTTPSKNTINTTFSLVSETGAVEKQFELTDVDAQVSVTIGDKIYAAASGSSITEYQIDIPSQSVDKTGSTVLQNVSVANALSRDGNGNAVVYAADNTPPQLKKYDFEADTTTLIFESDDLQSLNSTPVNPDGTYWGINNTNSVITQFDLEGTILQTINFSNDILTGSFDKEENLWVWDNTDAKVKQKSVPDLSTLQSFAPPLPGERVDSISVLNKFLSLPEAPTNLTASIN